MKIKIISRKKNPLLDREEIYFEISGTKITPSRNDLKGRLGSEFGANEKLLVVDKIESRFGSHTFKGYAKLYANDAAMKKIEPKYKIKRNFPEPKKEEAK
jgi:ribosomal protein S24E